MTRRALILAAHGSREAPEVNERIERWANHLAATTDFDVVAACFHQGKPAFAEVLDLVAADDVTVVPIMTSRGYYADHVLPNELVRNKRFTQTRVRITAPIGTHPRIFELARQRVRELCATHGVAEAKVTVAVVGHGTPRHGQSRRATVNLASQLGYALPVRQTLAVFIDDEPAIEEAVGRATGETVIVLPFMIGAGPHAMQDIPERLGMLASDAPWPRSSHVASKQVICDGPLGEHAAVLEMVADLAARADVANVQAQFAPRRRLRLGTRASKLALWQAHHVASALQDRGHAVDIVELSSLGDRIRDRAIADLPSDAPFTDDLDFALESGEIDIAVHSFKDVAIEPSRRFTNAAILPRGDAREALVARDGLTFEELPTGAIVGTSSLRREAQVRRMRPDLIVKSIRGPVDARVAQVREGKFDAAILAYAGLDRLGMLDQISETFPIETFVPTPAQAALLVQVRAGDEYATAIAQTLDDAASRAATALELDVLRALADQPNIAGAAYATVGDRARITVRLTTRDGAMSRDIVRATQDVDMLHAEVLQELRALLPEFAGGVAV
ncbi:MAG: hydroxymethylbilane synthase [Phycisphaerales bacterium]|nr:hydroxymethylbilane synthase [Phycisphaerales bacterium]